MTIINRDAELLRSAIRIMDEQHRTERERVRHTLTAATVPIPADVVETLCQLNPHDARDALRDHPGHSLWEKRRSYEASLHVFERSVRDLLRAIQDFEELSRDGSIFDRTRETELDEIGYGIQKELFAAANAAHALVDHSTRRLQKSIQVPGYDERRRECFGDDGLHEFMIGLRTILHHIQMLRPGWQVQRRFSESDHEASFKLGRDELSLTVEEAKKSFSASMLRQLRRYLEDAPGTIDLRQVCEEYRRRAREFHSWFSAEVEARGSEELRDYQRCCREIDNAAARIWWKMMLGNWLNWKTPPNPYNHLHRYLTPEQLEEVYRLPMRSPEQVDKVIEFVDRDGACDGELRELAYDLFRRSNPAPSLFVRLVRRLIPSLSVTPRS